MYTWLEAAVYCEETFGIQVDTKEGFFICPSAVNRFMSAIGVTTIGTIAPSVILILWRVNDNDLPRLSTL